MYQCGFRKGMSAKNCLLFMTEKWRACLDKMGKAGVLLTDLSETFDCLVHDLLIARLNEYGFDSLSLKLIHNYLTGRRQRIRINSHYSTWIEILFGVPQRSILESLLFNIYLCDFFLLFDDSDIANYDNWQTSWQVIITNRKRKHQCLKVRRKIFNAENCHLRRQHVTPCQRKQYGKTKSVCEILWRCQSRRHESSCTTM